MLAYVFWHWPLAGADLPSYESRLGAFHDRLAGGMPEGFRGSMIYRHRGAPWVPEGSTTYEDWYLLDGSAALDTLNEAAISGARREPHDSVARDAMGGVGGLYKLRIGEGGGPEMTCVHWFAKPAGMTYAELYGIIGALAGEHAIELWERQMVLGPAPEFSLWAREPMRLPERFEVVVVERAPIR